MHQTTVAQPAICIKLYIKAYISGWGATDSKQHRQASKRICLWLIAQPNSNPKHKPTQKSNLYHKPLVVVVLSNFSPQQLKKNKNKHKTNQ
jgi:hypothetical protein